MPGVAEEGHRNLVRIGSLRNEKNVSGPPEYEPYVLMVKSLIFCTDCLAKGECAVDFLKEEEVL